MRSTPKLLTAAEMRDQAHRAIEHFDEQRALHEERRLLMGSYLSSEYTLEDPEVWLVEEPEQYVFASYFGLFDRLGTDPPSGNHHIPQEILDIADISNNCVGIELLALGKSYGDIFDPEHWMYDSIRDYFASILEGHGFIFT